MLNKLLSVLKLSRELFIVCLIGYAVISYFKYRNAQTINESLRKSYEDRLEGLKQHITIKDNIILRLTKDKEGRIEARRSYVPDESTVTHKTDEDGVSTLRVKRWGPTIKLGIGYVPGQGVAFMPKGFFVSRWSVVGVVNTQIAGVGITRHIDDVFFGVLRPQNLEIGLFYIPLRRNTDSPSVMLGARIQI